MTDHPTRAQAIRTLGALIKDIKIAMLTTIEADGALRSRPMGTQQVEFDGDLWFFVGASSPKAHEISADPRVNVSYAQPDDQRYVSVSGTAELLRDREKIRELWSPLYKAWFAQGLDDPDLALLRVRVEQAEYWDAPSSKFVALAGFVKALATGTRADIGENAKLDL
ncbi:MAG TPA: pyridoxamine 5'-phosphate oxidase family protein [Kouleothrix sp.]|uniref:pyridoxamine 5'-phosphate oxidase family protein n=1 Tax=Kouleothrix sp. TaxID=2779161 RepID=UPI002BEFBE8C|nr:pyridoxamine 5'-phosphate oxidase family protein [Kouleothrix sp.]HRC75242.1 pyridoxamine 5'-phosphate oxidase family protein [Kouleothrix sp.]